MLLADTGPLFAAAYRGDKSHEKCVELLSSEPKPILVPALVITEVAYLLTDRAGPEAERAFAGAFRLGELMVEPVEPTDWDRICTLMSGYSDMNLGIVDASVIAAAERLGIGRLATLDRRDFSVVKPMHVESFELIP